MSYFISRSIHVPLLRARDSLGAALATWRLPARMAVRRCIGSMVGVGRPLFEGLRHSSLVRGRGGGHIRRTSKKKPVRSCDGRMSEVASLLSNTSTLHGQVVCVRYNSDNSDTPSLLTLAACTCLRQPRP